MKKISLFLLYFIYCVPLKAVSAPSQNSYIFGVAASLGFAATLANSYLFQHYKNVFQVQTKRATLADTQLPALNTCAQLAEKMENEHRTQRHPKAARQKYLNDLREKLVHVPALNVKPEIDGITQHDDPAKVCSWNEYLKSDCEGTDHLKWVGSKTSDIGNRYYTCKTLMAFTSSLKTKIGAKQAELKAALEKEDKRLKELNGSKPLLDSIDTIKRKKTIARVCALGCGTLTLAAFAGWFLKK